MPRRMRKVLLPLAAALAVAWVVTFAPAAQADNGCVASIQNPHISSNAGGVIAKGNWVCALVPTTIKLNNPYGAGFNLWELVRSRKTQVSAFSIDSCDSCPQIIVLGHSGPNEFLQLFVLENFEPFQIADRILTRWR